jgi:hypothetical protein
MKEIFTMLNEILTNAMPLLTAAITTGSGALLIKLNKINKRIDSIELRQEKHFSKENIEKELIAIHDTWVSLAPSEDSVILAGIMVENVLGLFHKVATENFTKQDFEKTMVLIDSMRQNSGRIGREQFTFDQSVHLEIEKIVELHVAQVSVDLMRLSEDDIFNDTFERLKNIFVNYAKGYMKDIVPIILKKGI